MEAAPTCGSSPLSRRTPVASCRRSPLWWMRHLPRKRWNCSTRRRPRWASSKGLRQLHPRRGLPRKYRFMLAADPRWCFEYQANAWYGSDPWLLYASINSEPTGLQDRCRDGAATGSASSGPEVRHGLRLHRPSGIDRGKRPRRHAGLGIPREVSSRSMRSRVQGARSQPRYGTTRAGGTLTNERADQKLRISDQDLRLLRLELKGCGTKTTAGELGLTAAAIDSRWQRLNRKLGSPHRQSLRASPPSTD